MVTYYATKAYILSLSVAINTELKKTKSQVRVVTICSGATQTAFFKNADFKNNKTKIYFKIIIMVVGKKLRFYKKYK